MKRFWELFCAFFKIGLFTFGGGLAMLPLIRNVVVEKKAWLSDEEMIDCIALCQALPGVIAVNSAIYVGKKQRGMLGAIAATFGVVLPSFLIIILVVLFLGRIENNPYVNGAFEGIKASSAGLIFVAAYKMGKQILQTKLAWFIVVVSFGIIVVGQITALWAIVFGGVVGYLSYIVKKRKQSIEEKKQQRGDVE